MSELFERVREARRRTTLSQDEFAARLSVTRGAVAQWEMRTGTAPTVDNLSKIARLGGVAFEWLATGRGTAVFGEPDLGVRESVQSYGHRTADAADAALIDVVIALSPNRKKALFELLRDERATPKRG